jgi:hypothetical protein
MPAARNIRRGVLGRSSAEALGDRVAQVFGRKHLDVRAQRAEVEHGALERPDPECRL